MLSGSDLEVIPTGIPVPDIFFDELDESKPQGLFNRSSSVPSSLSQQNTITPRELVDIMDHPGDYNYDNILILDVRFEYEFNGGRIAGARNVRTYQQLINIFDRYRDQNVMVVIHCEYSQERGPRVFHLFREYDRHRNTYPKLTYPNVFLLEGGFRRFYSECSHHCIGTYVAMRDDEHVNNGDLRRCHSIFTREMLQKRRSVKTSRMLMRVNSQSSSDIWGEVFSAPSPRSHSPLFQSDSSFPHSFSQVLF